MKIVIKISLILLGLFVTERLCHRATDGFSCMNIQPPKGEYLKWEQAISEEEKSHIKCTLAQPFYYLNCGSQSYVFLGEDGKTVLKFFKFQHMRIPPWIEPLPLPKGLNKVRQVKMAKKRAVLAKTFDSFQIAYEKMKRETGLLFLHLCPKKNLNLSVTIYDKIGKPHKLCLDGIPFLLQERAGLAYDSIDHWMANEEIEKAKAGINHLLKLSVKRCELGIFDKDPDFSTNFGFINDEAIQIDFGRLSLNENEKLKSIYGPEMVRITRDLELWIKTHHPVLLNAFYETLEEITS